MATVLSWSAAERGLQANHSALRLGGALESRSLKTSSVREADVAPSHASAPVKPRLLFVALSLDVGGAERHLASLLPELSRRGWPVTLFCMNRLGAYAGDVEKAGVEVIGPPRERVAGQQTRLGRIAAATRAGARLHAVLRRSKPRVAHFFLPEAYLIGAPIALLRQVPVCIMSRRGLNYYQANWPGVAAIEARLHSRMTAVLANSRRVVDNLVEEGCEREKIGLIYNGVALAGLDRAVDRVAVRREVGVAPDAVMALVVANLIPYKGHADLLRGLGLVKDQLPPGFRVVCIGRDEGARASLEALTAELGLREMVIFLGVRSDVPELLGASDLSILASHEEGFSNAIIEAMAAALPMVVTDVGGNGEAVVDGVTGLVVPARDPTRLGAAVARIAGDATMRLAFGRAGRQRVAENFTLAACVDQYEAVYEGLLAGKSISDLTSGSAALD